MKISTILLLLACFFTVHGTPVPQEEVEEEVKKDKEEVTPHAYTVPNSTWHYSTIEEILEEIAANKGQQVGNTEGHTINKRALGCAVTDVAYGSNTGSAFSDFTGTHPWPCGVDIQQIVLKIGSLIDSIQVRYRTVDNKIIQRQRRGGNGGETKVINLQTGERIIGVSGIVCYGGSYGTYVRQLMFFSQRQDGQKLTYGPYGFGNYFHPRESCRMFGVNGKINSIFGRVRTITGFQNGASTTVTCLGAIGFYYEDESTFSQHDYK